MNEERNTLVSAVLRLDGGEAKRSAVKALADNGRIGFEALLELTKSPDVALWAKAFADFKTLLKDFQDVKKAEEILRWHTDALPGASGLALEVLLAGIVEAGAPLPTLPENTLLDFTAAVTPVSQLFEQNVLDFYTVHILLKAAERGNPVPVPTAKLIQRRATCTHDLPRRLIPRLMAHTAVQEKDFGPLKAFIASDYEALRAVVVEAGWEHGIRGFDYSLFYPDIMIVLKKGPLAAREEAVDFVLAAVRQKFNIAPIVDTFKSRRMPNIGYLLAEYAMQRRNYEELGNVLFSDGYQVRTEAFGSLEKAVQEGFDISPLIPDVISADRLLKQETASRWEPPSRNKHTALIALIKKKLGGKKGSN